MTTDRVAPPSGVAGLSRGSWIRACVVGELGGFVPPALAGAVLFSIGAPELVLVLGLVGAGVVEGLVLGAAQSSIIARWLPAVTGWTRATAIAAGLAWLAGMGGSSLVQQLGPSALVVVGPAWIAGLLAMGVLQADRLAPHVDGAARWVPVTTAAWLVGVSLPVVALSVIPNGWPLVIHVAVAVGSAVAMGATVGAITAPTLARFARETATSTATSDDNHAFRRLARGHR